MALLYSNSPYIVSAQSNDNDGLKSCRIELWIYSGEKDSFDPTEPTLTLRSTALSPFEPIYIDIAGICSDYIETNYTGLYQTDAIWVSYRKVGRFVNGATQYLIGEGEQQINTLAGVDGYKFYEENLQRAGSGNDDLLMSTNTIRIPKGDNFKIPVYAGGVSSVSFSANGETYYTESVPESDFSQEQIKYIDSRGGDISEYLSKVAYLGLTFEENKCTKDLCYSPFPQSPDRVVVALRDGTSKVVKVEREAENLYEVVKLTFLSRYGVLRDLFFFKKSSKSLSVSRQEYTANTTKHIYETGSITKHQFNTYDIVGEEKETLNSGYVPESLNDDFRELLLSSKVWITKDKQILPVNIENSSMQYKTHLNDKLINYQIEAKYSYKKINRTR